MGRVGPARTVRGRDRLLPAILDLLDARLSGARRVRLGVAHVGAPGVVEEVTRALKGRYGAGTEVLAGPATAVLATHLGPGAWALAWMVEEA